MRARKINLADRRHAQHTPHDLMDGWVRTRPPLEEEIFFPAGWWDELVGHEQLDEWIAELRTAETAARKLRLRLEAQRTADPARTCEHCRQPFYARTGARYCSALCRAEASRARRAPKHDWGQHA